MAKMIDAEKLNLLIRDDPEISGKMYARMKMHINEATVVDAVEVVHGRNLDADTPSLFECSICHWSCNDTYYGDTADYNYCPNCGAKMDGDGNGLVR